MQPRTVLLVALLVLTAGLIVPTTGTPTTDADSLGDLKLQPHHGPSGAYAEVSSDGEIALQLSPENDRVPGEGVNPHAVTTFDCIFTMTNTGEETMLVRIAHDAEAVHFVDIGGPALDDGFVELEPGDHFAVGMTVDASDAVEGDVLLEEVRIEVAGDEAEVAASEADVSEERTGSSSSADTDVDDERAVSNEVNETERTVSPEDQPGTFPSWWLLLALCLTAAGVVIVYTRSRRGNV